MRRIGVDVGGTFTDLILVDDETGLIAVDKVPSTPDDPARGTVDGIRRVCDRAGATVAELDAILHGTTVATNIALTHTGAEVGLITTEGFRDILHIARHKKPFNFSLYQDLPWQAHPLVKRRHRLTVRERVTAPRGDVLVPLDDDEVRERARELARAGVEAVSVCLLHAYLNPEHERRVAAILREELPDAYLSVSHEVLPLYREYERFSTVSLNAYVGPKVSRYVQRLDGAVREAGFARDVQLMQSSGGTVGAAAASARPVSLLMSGPVAGLIGGIWAGRLAGVDSVITLDMGGTSADIGVAPGGELRMRHLVDTAVAGYQAMVPMVDVDAIGAGGGSIVHVDRGGVFRVGPASAGADPGPASYGRGGTDATSTDAQVLLGRLRPDRGLLGGEMTLDPDLARTAFEPVGAALGLPVEEAALGALQIQKYSMTQAIELNSVRRGYDPRDFTLVAAGGAGPLFACDVALELEIPRVLVPPHPGITSATGLLATDVVHEFVATAMQPLSRLEPARLEALFAGLEQQAVSQLATDGFADERAIVTRLADCRYTGQGYEVRFELPGGPIAGDWVDRCTEAFHRAHEREYGQRFDSPIEIVNVRVTGVGLVPPLGWPEAPAGSGTPVPSATRPVAFEVDGRLAWLDAAFHDRTALGAGDRISGPAVVEQVDTTTVIPPGFVAEVDRHGNLVIDCTGATRPARDEAAGLATPVLQRVIGGAFQSIAKEMAGVLFRMSYSSIIRESEDLGAGLFDAEGNELAESDSTPMFMGAMPKIVKGVIGILGDDIHDGDVIAHNNPYKGATHTPDIGIVVPIFWEGELIAFSAASAHLLDIGGAYPGMSIDLVDIWAEGQIWDAIKLYEQGVRQESVWKGMLTNVRTPTHNRGDIEAMIAGAEKGKQRFLDLVRRYGKDVVLGAAQDWLAYSEKMLRQEIAKVPDGAYVAPTAWLDDDGKNRGVMLPIEVTTIVDGDELTIDLTGSAGEVETAFNSPYEGTVLSAASYIARTIFLDEATFDVFVPQNEGMLRPVKVIAPLGSIFNPRWPRATKARFCQVQRVVDMMLKALAPVIPDKITAGNSANVTFVSYSGFDPEAEEYWVYLEVNEGSYGGRMGKDGMDSIDCLIANTRNNPIEELEFRFPMRTERYELRPEPASPGKWRGGVGIIRENRFLVDTIVACEGERFLADPPWGIFGGHDGTRAATVKNPGRADQESWPSKFTNGRMHADDVIVITTPNSGGYGDPVERDPELVLGDVLDGFTTLEQAREAYRVAIRPDLTLDVEETARLRTG